MVVRKLNLGLAVLLMPGSMISMVLLVRMILLISCRKSKPLMMYTLKFSRVRWYGVIRPPFVLEA